MFMRVTHIAHSKCSANASYYCIFSYLIIETGPCPFFPMGPHKPVPGCPAAMTNISHRRVSPSQRPHHPRAPRPSAPLLGLPWLAPPLSLVGSSREPWEPSARLVAQKSVLPGTLRSF